MKESQRRIALLISGGGTTASAVIEAYQKNQLTGIKPVLVISSNPRAQGIERAIQLGIDTVVLPKKEYISDEAYGDALLRELKKTNVDFISQNGWLPLTPKKVIEKYDKKIINQHPGPLAPGHAIDFGGKGMYGIRVAAARVAYAWLAGTDFWTETTTHFVEPAFDTGLLIRVARLHFSSIQEPVTVAQLETDTLLQQRLMEESRVVQDRLLPLEHENVIQTLQMFAGSTPVEGYMRPNPLILPQHIEFAQHAKKLAVKLFP